MAAGIAGAVGVGAAGAAIAPACGHFSLYFFTMHLPRELLDVLHHQSFLLASCRRHPQLGYRRLALADLVAASQPKTVCRSRPPSASHAVWPVLFIVIDWSVWVMNENKRYGRLLITEQLHRCDTHCVRDTLEGEPPRRTGAARQARRRGVKTRA